MQAGDGVLQLTQDGQRERECTDPLRLYWKARSFLTVCDNLLLFKGRIVISECLQKGTLEKIHNGHQGVERCRMRVRSSVWWLGISQHLSQMIQQCQVCSKMLVPRREPLLVTPLPEYPWQKVGTDLFEL